MKNSIVKLKCIDITVDFFGICKNDGLVIFVKGLIPGEIANVKIIKVKNRIAYGIIDELLKKSPYRTKEPCSVAYKCGGCNIQHISYDYQLLLKKRLIENTFNNMKLDVNVLNPIPSNNYYGYRNKIQVPVADNKVGYYRVHTNDIVQFDKCYVVHDVANNILVDIKNYISKYDLYKLIRHIVIRKVSDGIMVCLVSYKNNIPNINELINTLLNKYIDIKSIMLNVNSKDTNVIFGDLDICLYGDEYVIDKCDDISYMIPLRSFYQINSEQMKNLYNLIIENGNLSRKDNVLDLFCGIGTISLYISRYVNKVVGVEIIDKSIEYANMNKKINHIDNVEFILGDANSISKNLDNFDTVILDPPRKGIDSTLINSLIKSNVKKIIYVSCNQATLSRDLNLLKDSFSFKDVQPVDMFPNTKHIESITVLNRIV